MADEDHHRRNHAPPWGAKHKIPTVQQYRTDKEREASRPRTEDPKPDTADNSQEQNIDAEAQDPDTSEAIESPGADQNGKDAGYEDTSQAVATANLKARRKEMKHRDISGTERQVTDPVTHLPVTIRDFNDDDLGDIGEDDEEIDLKGFHGKLEDVADANVKQEENAQEVKLDDAAVDQLKKEATTEGHKVDVNELMALLQEKAQVKGSRPALRFGKEYGTDRSPGMGLYTNQSDRQARLQGALGRNTDAKRVGMYADAVQDGTMKTAFLPPEFENARREIAGVIKLSLMLCIMLVVLSFIAGGLLYIFFFWVLRIPQDYSKQFYVAYPITALAVLAFSVAGVTKWAQNQTEYIWTDEVTIAAERHRLNQEEAREEVDKESQSKKGARHVLRRQPESTHWLNSLVGSVWPLINPDLFASVSDMLEDVMQASLPRLVRMVSVEDIGQGSEPFRVLGIRWLPKGKAAEHVGEDGRAKAMANVTEEDGSQKSKYNKKDDQEDTEKDQNGRKAPEPEGDDQGDDDDDDDTDTNLVQGMEAEEGDFINLEIAFAYRPPRKKASKAAVKAAHLYLAFYLPGNIKLPVWVTLRGLVGTMRVRLQLAPDPPFFGLATVTFLGQPRVTLSCIPLVKRGLNIMDVPLISNFVQSAVDAAMSEYVAPKSLTLDLQSMLAGDDYKKDTNARGIFIVRIKHAFDFKVGDMAIPLVKDGSSDTYVSVGWAKFGKPVWSTRVIVNDMDPYWEEEAYIPVGPEELDADEKLRMQLWDSDRFTADDDLGRVELDIKMLMRNKHSRGTMWDRVDTFHALKAGEQMPGRFEWSVGYYPKTKLMDYQVEKQKVEPGVTTLDELRTKVYERAERKLRETVHDETSEVEQQKEQDFDKVATEVIASTPPSEEYPSGVLSIQIHQIMGLQLEEQGKNRDPAGELEGGEEKDDLLPDSYCTVILNHQKVFKTRTKPKNAKPFFNAVTERFIRDWRTTTIFISVRDARVHEDSPLLGIVYLPLGSLFRKRGFSCINETYPLAGGIGYGRMRVSLCFRSVDVQLPMNMLGWDTYGAVRIDPQATLIPIDGENKDKLPSEIKKHSVKFSTALSSVKMHPSRTSGTDSNSGDDKGYTIYKPHKRHGRSPYLGVQKRYSASLLLTFAHRSSSWFSSLLSSKSDDEKGDIYAILWLKDIPDSEHAELELPIYIGDVTRATANVLPAEKSGLQVGKIRISLQYLPGLDYRVHRGLYKRTQDVRDVVEVLECARDNGLFEGAAGQADPSAELTGDDDDQTEEAPEGLAEGEEDDSASSDDESSEYASNENGEDVPDKSDGVKNIKSEDIDPDLATYTDSKDAKGTSKNDGGDNAGGSIAADFKSYKRHQNQLHRRHRGLMQWKAPRTLKWVANKGRRAVESVTSLGAHEGRAPGVETEV